MKTKIDNLFEENMNEKMVNGVWRAKRKCKLCGYLIEGITEKSAQESTDPDTLAQQIEKHIILHERIKGLNIQV